MAGSDILMVVVMGVILIGGLMYLKENGGLEGIFGKKEDEDQGQVAIPPIDDQSPQEQEQEYQEPEPTQQPDYGAEADIQPQVVPQYIPVPVYMPQQYQYEYPRYSRESICRAEFGGSCNSECRNGPTRECRDCVYFCGQPYYKNYRRPPEPPRHYYQYRPPNKPRDQRCDSDEHWDRNEGKCVKNHGGFGPTPGHDCPRGQRYDWQQRKCVPVPTPIPQPNPPEEDPPKPTCPTGQHYDRQQKKCVANGPPRGSGKRKPKEVTKVSTPVTSPEEAPPAPGEATPTSTYARSYYSDYDTVNTMW